MDELLNKDTEEKILDAAKNVFINKGLDGARMQEIADEAKINKSLLHYYYRTKEKLFMAVFKAVSGKILPKSLEALNSDISIFEKIEVFVENYIDLLIKNPSIPLFVITELKRNPNGFPAMMLDFVKNLDVNIVQKVEMEVRKEIEKGTIREIDYRHLFINMLSMCIFPFAGRPLIQKIAFEDNSSEYDKFLKERAKEVSSFIINSIKI